MSLGNLVIQGQDSSEGQLTIRGYTTTEAFRLMKGNTGGGFDRTFALDAYGKPWISNTISTAGSVTINKPTGRVRVPNGSTSITVTNSLVTANSFVF
jgi:hypothetical protein